MARRTGGRIRYQPSEDSHCHRRASSFRQLFRHANQGPQIGKVFFFDHDDWREEPFAESFDEFLALVSSSPAALLSKTLGCTARYFDGSSNTQWIPTEYLPAAVS